MSTAAKQRVTRSASKARSTGASSTGAASRARSRAGASIVPLVEEDMPPVGNQVNRAYGTESQTAQAHLLSVETARIQGLNPIASAVSKAQAPETPIANTTNRLQTLAEGSEGSSGSRQPDSNRPTYRIGSQPPSIASPESGSRTGQSFLKLSRLFPYRDWYNREGLTLTPNFITAGSTQGHTNTSNGPQSKRFRLGRSENRETSRSWAVIVRNGLLVLAVLFGTIWLYEGNHTRPSRVGSESETSKDINTTSPVYHFLQKRVAKLEQLVQDLSISPSYPETAADKHQINWFTQSFGAGIDLFLSSPTVLGCDPSWTSGGWPWSMFKTQTCPEITLSLPHYAALSPWNDPVDDSWCAPPSDGKLQLTVILPRTIVPTELVVEHASMDEMPVGFMGSSPREVELWIQVEDDTLRATLVEALSHINPSLLKDSSPQGKALGEDQALPVDFVPVGRWEYDIWTKKRLQSFPLPFDLAHHGVSTNKVAVRVNSNWGNVRFTCVSRLRLYGEDGSGTVERLDVGMGPSR